VRSIAWLAVAVILGLPAGCGPSPPGYTPFFQAEHGEPAGRVDPDSVEVWFSPLSSVEPYVHVSTTGLAVEAPEADPREFCSPDSIAKRYVSARGWDVDPASLIGLPSADFRTLGELTVPIYIKGIDSPPTKYENTIELGPHKKPFRVLKNVDWADAFAELRWRASKAGADAIIEVCGGRLPVSFWYPPRPFGPLPQSGGASILAVRGEGITDWALIGVAVVWIQEPYPEQY
jgi:hypothetical protein